MIISEFIKTVSEFTLGDYLFYLLILLVSWRLLWELIPDGLKEYWKYVAQDKKDQRKGQRRKWSFLFKK